MSAINFSISNKSINTLRAQRDALQSKTTLSTEEALQLASTIELLFAMRRAYHAARSTRKALMLATSK